MVMRAAPVCDCYEDIVKSIGKRPRVVYMTPQGYTFTQSMAEKFAKEDNLVILCGHYEGIDERALENIVFQEFLIMKNLLKQRAFQMVCLSIRNTQDQQIITGKLFQRCFYQVIMLILKSGDMKSHWRELRNTDQICMKHM